MRTSVRNGIAGTALLALGVGVGLAAGWDAGSSGPSASGLGATAAEPRATNKSAPVFSGQLVSYNSCDALLAALRARGRQLVGPYGFNTGGAIAYSKGAADLQLRGGSTAASVPSLAPVPASASASQTLTHSDTNNQVVGVDEPDVVKTNGKVMVSLDGQRLHIVDVRTPRLDATIALPYPGTELLLAGDEVVVLSGQSANYSASSTTATVVDLSNPAAPRIARSFTFDASELAARVVNGTIRLVLSTPPPVASWASPQDTSAAAIAAATKINQSIIDALPLDAWLPHWSDGSGRTERVSSCDSVAIPRATAHNTPTSNAGVGMVTVLSLDPTKPAPGAGLSVFGAASTAYAEGTHLYASDDGTYSNQILNGSLVPAFPIQNATIHLLEFDISDPTQARFLASGSVAGQLHDAYSFSEYQDALRVTTTTTTINNATKANFVSTTTSTGISVLVRRGDQLVQVGHVGGLGPGEQVYAVRYVGDRGYVVTFQQIDPLHVVDLSNPAKPVLRGTLTLAGYSSLLQPLPHHQLLGIGRAVAATPPASGCAGSPVANCVSPIETTDGLQLVLFDVTDAAHPKVLAKQVLSGAYAVDPNSPHTITAAPTDSAGSKAAADGGYFVMPSTNGLLGLRIAGGHITVTTGAFSKPYTVQTGRAIFAGTHVFELGDRGVTVRRSADLRQDGWVAF
jgi:hypothetical protein